MSDHRLTPTSPMLRVKLTGYRLLNVGVGVSLVAIKGATSYEAGTSDIIPTTADLALGTGAVVILYILGWWEPANHALMSWLFQRDYSPSVISVMWAPIYCIESLGKAVFWLSNAIIAAFCAKKQRESPDEESTRVEDPNSPNGEENDEITGGSSTCVGSGSEPEVVLEPTYPDPQKAPRLRALSLPKTPTSAKSSRFPRTPASLRIPTAQQTTTPPRTPNVPKTPAPGSKPLVDHPAPRTPIYGARPRPRPIKKRSFRDRRGGVVIYQDEFEADIEDGYTTETDTGRENSVALRVPASYSALLAAAGLPNEDKRTESVWSSGVSTRPASVYSLSRAYPTGVASSRSSPFIPARQLHSRTGYPYSEQGPESTPPTPKVPKSVLRQSTVTGSPMPLPPNARGGLHPRDSSIQSHQARQDRDHIAEPTYTHPFVQSISIERDPVPTSVASKRAE